MGGALDEALAEDELSNSRSTFGGVSAECDGRLLAYLFDAIAARSHEGLGVTCGAQLPAPWFDTCRTPTLIDRTTDAARAPSAQDRARPKRVRPASSGGSSTVARTSVLGWLRG